MIHKRKPTGQTLLEFALIIPIFLFIVLVFIDLGRAISLYQQLSNAVREGSRFAVVHQSGTTAEQNAIKNVMVHFMPGMNTANITIVPPTIVNPKVQIVATYQYQPITPGLAMILGNGNSIELRVESNALVAPIVQLTPVPTPTP